jgi:hypothetical protein
LQELWELLKAYAQQETVGPLKNLGRQLGLGLAGSVFIALGVFLLVLSVMRGLQSHTLPDPVGTFFQVHDWIVYLIAGALLGLAIFLCVLKAKANPLPSSPGTDLAEERS